MHPVVQHVDAPSVAACPALGETPLAWVAAACMALGLAPWVGPSACEHMVLGPALVLALGHDPALHDGRGIDAQRVLRHVEEVSMADQLLGRSLVPVDAELLLRQMVGQLLLCRCPEGAHRAKRSETILGIDLKLLGPDCRHRVNVLCRWLRGIEGAR